MLLTQGEVTWGSRGWGARCLIVGLRRERPRAGNMGLDWCWSGTQLWQLVVHIVAQLFPVLHCCGLEGYSSVWAGDEWREDVRRAECTGVLLYWCSGVLVYLCTGVLVYCWCTGEFVYWCSVGGIPEWARK